MIVVNNEQRAMERFRRDIEYFEANRDSLIRDHPNEWMAIYEGRIGAVAGDLGSLFDELERQGIPLGEAVIEYLSTEEEVLILFQG